MGRRNRANSVTSVSSATTSPFTTSSRAKKNAEFHALFKSIPLSDYFIESYNCALQKDILLQGKMYLSERHIAFYSNIFGWVTNLIIKLDEIVAFEKKSAALIFPNSISISTLHGKDLTERDYRDLDKFQYRDVESVFCDDELEHNVSNYVPFTCIGRSHKLAQSSTGATMLEPCGSVDNLMTVVDEGSKIEVTPFPMGQASEYDCGCARHREFTIIDERYFMTLNYLYALLFNHNTEIRSVFLKEKGCLDVTFGKWVSNNVGQLQRIISFKFPLIQFLSSTYYSVVLIERSIRKSSKKYAVLETSLHFPDLPVAAYFDIKIRLCMTSIDYLTSRLIISASIYVDRAFSLLTNRIKELFYAYLTEHFKALDTFLKKAEKNINPDESNLTEKHIDDHLVKLEDMPAHASAEDQDLAVLPEQNQGQAEAATVVQGMLELGHLSDTIRTERQKKSIFYSTIFLALSLMMMYLSWYYASHRFVVLQESDPFPRHTEAFCLQVQLPEGVFVDSTLATTLQQYHAHMDVQKEDMLQTVYKDLMFAESEVNLLLQHVRQLDLRQRDIIAALIP